VIKETLRFAKDRKTFHLFMCVYILISLIGMFFTPLFDEDEGFFAEASRQMLASGDFVTINVNGEERYDKPALFFWINALSLKLFGINEFAVRLPSFIFFILTLILLFNFSKKYFQTSNAYISVIIMTSIVQFQVLGRASVSDNLLNLLVASALFSFYSFEQNNQQRSLFAMYTFAGLGLLTKGPIAFIIIFGVILFYLFFTQNLKFLRRLLHPLYLLWAFLIPLPWFYMAYKRSGEFLFYDFLIKHNIGRFTNTMESHGGYFWYYIPVLFLAFLPFGHLIIAAFKNINFNKKNIFLATWFLVPLILFSFSKTQLPHYISIGFFPLIILISQSKTFNPLPIFLQILFLLILFTILPQIVLLLDIQDEFVNSMLQSSSIIFDKLYTVFMVGVILLAVLFYFFFREKILLLLLVFLLATTVFIYKFSILQQEAVKEMGLKLKNTPQKVFMNDHYNPSLSFYAQRVFEINKNPNSGDTLFVKYSKKFSSENTVLSKKNGYLLIKKK
jgi:4-amino-4-deoxy-L-arabinose transferase-like glycosyltransferase